MPATARRSLIMTVFGVLGILWFALHAVEYVYARYDTLQARVPLPDPLGLSEMFAAMPQWAAISLTAAIWLGLLGAVLLLLRDSAAVLILSLTLIATLPVAAWAGIAFFGGMAFVAGVNLLFFAAGQVAVTFGLWLYARTAKRYGLF
jgi:hypothetical protein